MALPSSMTANPFKRAVTGIRLGIVPSTQLPPFEVELQRSTANSTASSMWRSDFLAPAGAGYSYTVELPLSTRTFYFRARHVGLGYSAGTFSPTVSAKPVKLGGTFTKIGLPRNKVGNYEAIGADLWLSSAKTAKVGTQQTTGTVSKSILVPFAMLQPKTNTATLAFTTAYAHPNSTAATTAYASVVLPENTILSSISWRLWKSGATDTIQVDLFRVNTTGGVTNLKSNTYSPGSGFFTFSSGLASPETVTSTKHYLLRVIFDSAAAAADTRFYWYRLTYKMGQYTYAY